MTIWYARDVSHQFPTAELINQSPPRPPLLPLSTPPPLSSRDSDSFSSFPEWYWFFPSKRRRRGREPSQLWNSMTWSKWEVSIKLGYNKHITFIKWHWGWLGKRGNASALLYNFQRVLMAPFPVNWSFLVIEGSLWRLNTEIDSIMRSRFCEVCSCCSWIVLPGPAWVLRNNVLHRIK